MFRPSHDRWAFVVTRTSGALAVQPQTGGRTLAVRFGIKRTGWVSAWMGRPVSDWVARVPAVRFSLFDDRRASVTRIGCCPNVPCPPKGSPDFFGDGDVERGEAVHLDDTNLEFGDPTIEVPRGQPLAQGNGSCHLVLYSDNGTSPLRVESFIRRETLVLLRRRWDYD